MAPWGEERAWSVGAIRLHICLIIIGIIQSCSGLYTINGPRIKVSPQLITVKKSGVAVVVCEAEGNPTPILHWRVRGERIDPRRYRYHITDVPGRSVLSIDPSRITRDQGSYSCVAENRQKAEAEAVIKVHRGPIDRDTFPRFSTSPENTAGWVGESTTLRCEATGDPLPTVMWIKNHLPLNSTDSRITVSESGSLHISRLSVLDQGWYRCLANNSEGFRASQPVRLRVTVLESPEIKLRIHPAHQTVASNRRADIFCINDGTQPTFFRWVASDGTEINRRSNRYRIIDSPFMSVLSIEPTKQKRDNINVTCVAESETRAFKVKSQLVVEGTQLPQGSPSFERGKHFPYLIEQGSTTEIRCDVVGEPEPTIDWLRNDMLLDVDNPQYSRGQSGELKIVNTQPKDAGRYECIARNRLGVNFSPTTQVFVHRLDHEHDTNKTFQPNLRIIGDRFPVEGKRFELMCKFETTLGSAEPVDWFKDGEMVSATDRHTFSNSMQAGEGIQTSTLVIREPRLADAGTYVCRTPLNTLASVKVFVVQDSSRDLTINGSARFEGEDMKITCNVTGHSGGDLDIAWFKDGQRVDTPGTRFAVSRRVDYVQNKKRMSSTLIIARSTMSDSGNYTCLTNNNQTKSIYIQVREAKSSGRDLMLPKDKNVFEGGSVIFICEAPDTATSISWKHSNGKMPVNSSIFDRFGTKSALKFPAVSLADEGVVTCIVDDSGWQRVSSADLHVYEASYWRAQLRGKGYPVIVLEPESDIVERGTSVELRCSSRGHPKPSIIWLKDHFPVDTTNKRFSLLSSGTLQISNVTERDEGDYECEAENEVGVAYSAPAVLEVVETTSVSPGITITGDLRPAYGSNATLVCEAIGVEYTPSNVGWFKDGYKIRTDSERYSQTKMIRRKIKSFKSILTIANIQVTDNGLYVCNNLEFGHMIINAARLIAHKDLRTEDRALVVPQNLTVRKFNFTGTKVVLTWDLPSSSLINKNFVMYEIKYYKLEDLIREQILNVTTNGTYTDISGLEMNTDYKIKMRAYTSRGPGPWSNRLNFRTTETRIPPAPTNVKVQQTSNTSFRVSWDTPGFPVAGYKIYYSMFNIKTMDYWSSMETGPYTVAEVSGLEPNTVYGVKVQAKSVDGYYGTLSEMVTKFTEEPPVVPQNLTVRKFNLTGTKVVLTWDLPSSSLINKNFVMYEIKYYKLEDLIREQILNVTTNGTYTDISGLEMNSDYQIKMRAYTSRGPGPWSNRLNFRTTGARSNVPSPPRNLHVDLQQEDPPRIKVTWQKPRETHGPLENYKIIWGRIGERYEERILPSKKYSFVTYSLDKGTTYEFRVSAKNDVDYGERAVENLKTPDGAPAGAPQNFTATGISETSVRLTWDLPARPLRNGDIAMYQIRYHKLSDPINEEDLNVTDTFVDIWGLEMNTDYKIKMRAYTSRGPGPWSNRLNFRTTGTRIPPAPTNVKVQQTSNTSFRVSWDTPGFPVAGYKIYYSMFNIKTMDYWSSMETGPYTVAEVSGLEPNTVYGVKVQAKSVDGYYGTLSEMVTNEFTEELVPQNLTVRKFNLTGAKVVLTWDHPSSSLINKDSVMYEIKYYKLEDLIRQKILNVTTNGTHTDISDLEMNSDYQIKMRAYTSRGPGPWSDRLNFRTSAPVVPQNLTVRKFNLTGTKVVLTWDLPSSILINKDFVMYEIKYYKLEDLIREQILNVTTNGTHTDISDLEMNSDYQIKMRAYTSRGPGPWSDRLNFRTSGQSNATPSHTPGVTITGDLRPEYGSNATLTCESIGVEYTPSDIYWFKGGKKIMIDSEKYSEMKMTRRKIKSLKSILTIANIQVTDNGRYVCRSSDFQVTSASMIGLKVRKDVVRNFRVSSHTSTMVKLSWDPPVKQGISFYLLKYEGGKYLELDGLVREIHQAMTAKPIDGGKTSWSLDDLKPKMKYEFNISAFFHDGTVGSEQHITVETLSKELKPPTEFNITRTGSSRIQLHWVDPNNRSESQQEGVDRHYAVLMWDGEEQTKYRTDKPEMMLSGLDRNGTFNFSVRVEEGEDTSPWTNITFHPNMDGPPGSVQEVRVRALSPSMVIVWWKEPEVTITPILRYMVFYTDNPGNPLHMWKIQEVILAKLLVLTDLTPDTVYTFGVRAYNKHGQGPMSELVQTHTDDKLVVDSHPPSAPTNLQLEAHRGIKPSMTATWEIPDSTHGTIQTYDITWGTYKQLSRTGSVPSNKTRYLVTGLEYNTTYIVTVSATNKVGNGDPVIQRITTPTEFEAKTVNESVSINGSTKAPQSAPENLLVRPVTPTAMLASWDEVESPDGLILNYKIIYTSHPEHPFFMWNLVEAGMDTSTVMDGLAPSTTYYFIVQAYSVVGEGPLSNPVKVLGSPQIIFNPEIQHVKEGGVASFFCRSSDGYSLKFHWMRNSKVISVRSPIYAIITKHWFSVLRVLNADALRDSGAFTCIASNEEGTTNATGTLKVYDVTEVPMGYPEITQHPQVKAVERGGMVTMSCGAEGDPLPNISWLKDSFPVHVERSRITALESGVLVITEAKESDVGKYECVAENPVGVAYSNGANLYVRAQKVPPSFSNAPSNMMVKPGSNVNLTCAAFGVPMPFVKWRDGNRDLTDQASVPIGQNVLQLKDVKMSKNYTCIATTDLHRIEMTVEVTVGEAPIVTAGPRNKLMVTGQPLNFYCHATGYPLPRFIWMKNFRDIIPKWPKHEIITRFNVSTLRIKDVTNADSGLYSCRVSNKHGVARATASLEVHSETPSGYPTIVRQPLSKAVKTDKPVVMNCEATGDPQPTIHWQKGYFPVDTNDTNIKLLDSGSLEIKYSRTSDDGRYECVAENIKGSAYSQAATLLVRVKRVPPSFTIHPVDHVVTPGSNVNLTCAAEGSPMPTVKWLQGTEELTYEVPIGQNNLQLKNVRETKTYTCVATSSLGQEETMATVIVAEQPNITLSPKDQRSVNKGVASFVCKASGLPAPTFGWKKDSELLRTYGSNHEIKSLGDISVLRIHSVRRSKHAGFYVCIATNQYGEAQAAASLTIHNEKPSGYPEITLSPSLKVVESGRSAVMPCEAEGRPRPIIRWLKDYFPVNISDPRIKVLTSGYLQIRQSRPTDQGKYECVAENIKGSAYSFDAAFHVRVRRVPPTFSIVPTDMFVKNGSDLNLTCAGVGSPMPFVKWREGSRKLTDEARIPIGRNILQLKNVQGSTNYTCIISSVLGEEETSALIVASEQVPPSFPPRDVRVRAASSSTIVVGWEKPEKLDPIGFEGYIVYYTKQPEEALHNWDIKHVGRDTTFSTISSLSGNTPYTVAVAARSRYGLGPMSSPVQILTVTGFSSPDHIPTVPRRLVAEALSANKILVTWQAPLQGIVDSYELYITNKNTSDKRRISIRPPAERYTITDLIPETTYDIKVAATSRHGKGPNSPKVSATTEPFVPGAPTITYVEEYGTEIYLRWKPSGKGNGTILGYYVWHQKVNPAYSYSFYQFNVRKPEAVVPHLKPDTRYNVRVAAYTKHGTGNRTRTWTYRTKPAAAGDAPQKFQGTMLGSGGVRVHWNPPLSFPTQDILHYELVFYPRGEDSVASTRQTNSTVTDVGPFPRDTVYFFKVRAHTANGAGSYASMLFTTF